MKPTHLKTLSARIDEISSLYYESDDKRFLSFHMNIYNYNNFLKQPLTLSQFVPCGADGKPLVPFVSSCSIEKQGYCCEAMEPCECGALATQYDNAQKRVIFEGWEVENGGRILTNKSTGDFIAFYDNGNVYYDVSLDPCISGALFRQNFLGTNPTLADLAAATISNPIKFK